MTIPVRNIYYLLCYAWDHVREGETVDVGTDEFSEMVDLFAKVLNDGVSRLITQGLDRDYLPISEDIRGIKGKLDLATTVKRNLLPVGMTHCAFDELSYDVPQNQILKATLRQLLMVPNLDPEQRRRAGRLHAKLDPVSEVPLRPRMFRTVRIHRNNQFYSFLIRVCRLIYDRLLVNQEEGTAEFYDFREDEQSMGRIFELFVRRFFQRETDYAVDAPKIDWVGARGIETDLRHLPRMQTDVVLRSPARTIILDTKFYKNPLDTRYDGERLKAHNLYQIFAYATNWAEGTTTGDASPEGWLLYAAVDGEFDHRFELMGRQIRACSVDLAQEWQALEQRLKTLALTNDGTA